MRICSLLPSITETLFELGLGGQVVGVTHECDWPSAALAKPKLTRSRIRGEACSSAEIDRLVQDQAGSLYDLETETLERLLPDVIFTQSLCPVCAVDESMVRTFAASLPNRPQVFSYQPTRLADVLAMIAEIGAITAAGPAASQLSGRFEHAIRQVQEGFAGAAERPRVLCLEWTDPPFTCGHWTPELVDLAGGTEVLGQTGQPSRRTTWTECSGAEPEMLMIAPCGFSLGRTLEELPLLQRQPEWSEIPAVKAGRVFCTDGSAYFNRPGPRLIESLFILAEAMHPHRFAGLAPLNSFQQVAPSGRMTGR